MSNHIGKDNPKRWVYVKTNESGESSLSCFGYIGEQGVNEIETGFPVLEGFLTEQELEIEVNLIADIPDYYKDSVETESNKFLAPSGIYDPIEVIVEE